MPQARTLFDPRAYLIIGVLVCHLPAALADEPVHTQCPVIADTTITAVAGPARDSNAGGVEQVVCSAERDFVLLRFDLSKLRDVEVSKATLRLRQTRDLLVRTGLSTVAAGDWGEGDATPPEALLGGACYNYAAYAPDERDVRWWAEPGSDFSDVVFGNGGSRWRPAVARFDKHTGWYEIGIPPVLIQAMVQGVQTPCLCISDDFGRQDTGPSFASRESANPPELHVDGWRSDRTPARAPANVSTSRDRIGREWVTFEAPDALGFEIYVAPHPVPEKRLDEAVRFEPWAVPGPGGEPRKALLSLFRRRHDRHVGVRAVETGHTWSPIVWAALPERVDRQASFKAASLKRFRLPTDCDRPFTLDAGPALSLDGRWIRSAEQTWWDPYRGPITLQAGRNEFVAFQIVLAGGPGKYGVTLADWQSPGLAEPAPQTRLYRQHYVKARLGQEKFAPDVARPIRLGETLDLELLTPVAATQPTTRPLKHNVTQAIWVDIYIPHKTSPGVWRSRVIALRDGRALLDLPIEIEVVNATLPDELAFKLSLSSTDLPAEVNGHAGDAPEAWELFDQYQRMAHEHRATLAVVPYKQDGTIHPGFAPRITVENDDIRVDWEEWDGHFGRYLDGAAFRDLPREAVPLDHFILPFCESWPYTLDSVRAPARSPLASKYHHRTTWTEWRPTMTGNPRLGEYMRWPIEKAIGDEYQRHNATVLQNVAKHLKARGWSRTDYQLFLNNHYGRGPRASWWLLREPRIFDDFLAVRFWMQMYRHALSDVGENPLCLRADLALPQWQRHTLAGLLDLAVLNDTLLSKNRLILGAPDGFESLWFSGTYVPCELGWADAIRWAWTARLAGARGLVIREALAADEDWDKATDTRMLYPGRRFDYSGAYASLRLKALRRAQQDLDWLELWLVRQQAAGVDEGPALSAVAANLAACAGGRHRTGYSLLPVLEFPGRLDTVAFEEVRRGVRQALSE